MIVVRNKKFYHTSNSVQRLSNNFSQIEIITDKATDFTLEDGPKGYGNTLREIKKVKSVKKLSLGA